MTRLVRLPAGGCRHFVSGRCLYEEALNPGYQTSYRCTVVLELHGLYDGFLTRAEAFGLSESTAADLWERRFLELCRQDAGCQDRQPGDMNAFPGCAHCLGDVCVLRLPSCDGRCRNFSPQPRD
ncbi:hypothetical protein NNJEOMEG_02416 [Fundidesulfovibrio magnetotacticus]|uniref:Uncharacterized protein n=1 Tax=Fundidesulfovibrio magnetotacticus TaxID=2730080 RepID=A0A6V8LWV9_9BACT|nr:hypothetical protein [Fundidesulfovibrio magnetotacticus]GFK94569.1 hypothetical protein NNJEOMEG_02416 [Fundidesulfovibrio magnetotacticus]